GFEFSPDVSFIQRRADGGGENERPVDPPRTGEKPLSALVFSLAFQRFEGKTRERHDSSAAFTLRFNETQLLADALERLMDAQNSPLEIHIDPSQAQHFAET